MTKKTLGRASGSLNAPIAAFTMAILLTTYCVSSINTARREAQTSSGTTAASSRPKPPADRNDQTSWVQQALEESRETERRKGA
ncbi:hypothetical protein EYZ11_012597 [Aspergillus tanneri]|uniref:Uncharacterized protein n=1 Tax=Aspergillus tanneri TaxID=1220188 RepID=A0A4V3UMN2_9EURO|nr:uncharacterized protein ATNIH1004_005057 [Aspergillus tanneri]KAA8649162.1 hypothetical protein ATNIH1004_005057 [Aspergillus tanneri]THC87954.1 hypothetical protein EYZ11_012597 [Aspergillus tanneri]